jgi:hypothetical protein
VYEMFLDISKKSDTIRYLAMKGADAPRQRENMRLGQNGLFYSKYGDITIRGNGQDLAEFDMLLVDSDNHVSFAEVVTSPADLKEFEIEIAYKKRLLGYLYGQKITPFLLVSSFDLSNYTVVKRLTKDKSNAIIHTSSCEQIKSLVKHYRPRIIYNLPENHPKLIRATDIPMKHPFEYRRYHDEVKNRLLTEINQAPGRIHPTITDQTGQLVKKVLYGGLFPPAVRAVCDTYGMTVKGKKITPEEFPKYYSKAIIATDLPEYELIIYLRSKQKKEYHKMIQMKDGHFKYERPTPPRVGFFLWLESIQPTLGTRITLQVLDAFSIREQVRR